MVLSHISLHPPVLLLVIWCVPCQVVAAIKAGQARIHPAWVPAVQTELLSPCSAIIVHEFPRVSSRWISLKALDLVVDGAEPRSSPQRHELSAIPADNRCPRRSLLASFICSLLRVPCSCPKRRKMGFGSTTSLAGDEYLKSLPLCSRHQSQGIFTFPSLLLWFDWAPYSFFLGQPCRCTSPRS